MKNVIYILFTAQLFISCVNKSHSPILNSVLKVEMYLNPNGISSENFPAIDAKIDFVKKKSQCLRKYPSPRMRDAYYALTEKELDQLFSTLSQSDLAHLPKTNYSTKKALPKSTAIIYTKETKYIIEDYGLNGQYPLSEMYKLVYKF